VASSSVTNQGDTSKSVHFTQNVHTTINGAAAGAHVVDDFSRALNRANADSLRHLKGAVQ
jgi:hypothetical protein